MQMIEISKLKPHPMNNYFFDDIVGDKWEDFKKSILRRGVVEGVVATQDLIIVSGHQRVRACQELRILEIPCRITHYPEHDERLNITKEDMILEDLICTNIMQRGVGNVNPMKMAKCIVELERIYGIKHGNNQRTLNNSNSLNQKQLAEQLQIDQSQLINYKKLNDLIPELQTLVETDQLKGTTAYKIWAKLSKDEQEEFFNQLGIETINKLTQKQTQEIINEKLKIQNEYDNLVDKLQEQHILQSQINQLKQELRNRPTIEIEKEVIPSDYNTLKTEIKNKDSYFNNLKRDYDEKVRKMQLLEDEIKTLKDVSESEIYTKKLKDSALTFCSRVNSFFENIAGLAWLAEHINELPQYEKNSYIKSVQLVEDWATAVKMNMKQYIE